MSIENTYDLIVIGGGPAGYAAAIRAGQLGKKVACIEKERAGGTCLNWGCIPTKALLKSAECYQTFKEASKFGIYADNLRFNFSQVMQRSRTVADNMGKGIEFLFKKNKVDYFLGTGHIPQAGKVTITDGQHSSKNFSYKHLLLATGCTPKVLPTLPVDSKRILTSREALTLQDLPKSIAILGAGAIGVEFAYFLNTFGCKVHLIEMAPTILSQEDGEVSALLEQSLKKQGIQIYTNTKTDSVEQKPYSVVLNLIHNNQPVKIEADKLLQAIGIAPNLRGLLGPDINLDLDKGYIKVDERYATNIPGIYASGDIIGPPWLAHIATFEAIQCVEGIFENKRPKRAKHIPACTYCQPQVASIGLTEEAAKKAGVSYKIGKFPFNASGKAVAANHPEGFVKVLVGDYDEILGAHIIGSEATELIAEYSLAMELEATVHEVHATIHPHPTFSEALAEAASAALRKAIHI